MRNDMKIERDFEIAFLAQQIGDLKKAERLYKKILERVTDHVDALNFLGVIYFQNREYEKSVYWLKRAISTNPNVPSAHSNLGVSLQEIGDLEGAIFHFDRAIQLRLDYAEAFFNRGNALHELKRFEEAIESYSRAITIRPDYADARCARVQSLFELKRYDDIETELDVLIRMEPNFASAYHERTRLRLIQGNTESALADIKKAEALDPRNPKIFNLLSTIYGEAGDLDKERAYLEEAIKLKPDYADAHWARSLVDLRHGNFERGWSGYEWRLVMRGEKKAHHQEHEARKFFETKNKSVLVYAEQGFGDTFHFCRYIPLVAAHAKKLYFKPQNKLMIHMKTLAGEFTLIQDENEIEEKFLKISLMSLPFVFQTNLETIPSPEKYLSADTDRIEKWKHRLGDEKFKIGISWAGNPDFTHDKQRSFSLENYLALADILGIRLISLQKNKGVEEISRFGAPLRLETLDDDFDEGDQAFSDTAAVMENLDLIITSDTAIAHLAGALGRPCWVALQYLPEWRWMLDRSDSPWYKSMRLFRQKTRGDWHGVFAQIADALRLHLQAHSK